MSVEVTGFYSGHNVSLDATTDWPTVHITCSCGWTSTVDGEAEHGIKDAIARVWIHTGGPAREGKEVMHLDHNLLDSYIDECLSQVDGELGT